MIRFTTGVVLTLAILLGTLMLEGGDGWSLLGLSAFLMVWFVPFFSSAAVWGYRAWAQAWGAAFHKVDAKVAQRSAQLWRFNEFVFYLAGLLAFIAAMVLVLSNAELAAGRWGHVLAASLIAPLYGCFFGFVARILRARVETTNS